MSSDVGFTGTRHALTSWQVEHVGNVLSCYYALGFRNFHHGDCTGADEFAASTARDIGYKIICHPPDNPVLRAWTKADEMRGVLPYLVRNSNIVNGSQAGLVVPNTEHPQARSGTWSTLRKFSQAGVPYWVISPRHIWFSSSSVLWNL